MFAPSAKDAPLYGQQNKPKEKSSANAITSAGSLAFTSQLSSLLSSGTSRPDTKPSRARSGKEDIFSGHKQQKKAAKNKEQKSAESRLAQKHSVTSDAVDDSAWHRSRRRMEDKARLYAAMKRGDVDDDHGKHMVDFDRKWAERTGDADDAHESSSDDSDPADQEMVEWTDEFGRTRTGTRAQQAQEKRAQLVRADNDQRARPAAPERLIYGDTVQDEAFDPETAVADKMAELAAKRDKSLTPPPETYFDGTREMRSKGVGFMQFSLDESHRKTQMDALERDRSETERLRTERARKLQERKDEVERRRKEMQEKKGKRKADDLLDELGAELGASLDAKRRQG